MGSSRRRLLNRPRPRSGHPEPPGLVWGPVWERPMVANLIPRVVRRGGQRRGNMQSMGGVGGKVVVLPLVALLLVVPVARAQRTTGSIIGTVTDTTGGVVADARVVAKNFATNLERMATTDTAGFYRMDLLPIGAYTVTVEKAGFRREVLKNIQLQIDQEARNDV